MKNKTKKISFNLKKIMDERGLKQSDVARMTGIHKNQISLMLRAYRGIYLKTIEKICNGLEIGVNDLISME